MILVMGDERLRQLAREVGAGGLRDRVHVLAERVRMGVLAQDRLALASYCGDPIARLVAAPVPVPVPTSTKEWFLGLARFGKPIAVRAAILAAEPVRKIARRMGWHGPSVCVEAAKVWVEREPSEVLRKAASEAAIDWFRWQAETLAIEAQVHGTIDASITRAAYNACLAAARLDRTPAERARAAKLAARDAAAAAFNVLAFEKLRAMSPELADALMAHHLDGPVMTDMRPVVERELAAWALADERDGAVALGQRS